MWQINKRPDKQQTLAQDNLLSSIAKVEAGTELFVTKQRANLAFLYPSLEHSISASR